MNRPAPVPASSASATVAQMPPTSPTPMNAAARIRSDRTAIHRRDQRSAMAPNSGPSSIAGMKSAIRTSVMAHGECQRWYASTTSAT